MLKRSILLFVFTYIFLVPPFALFCMDSSARENQLIKNAFASISQLQKTSGSSYDKHYEICIENINTMMSAGISIDTVYKGTTILHAATAIGDPNIVFQLVIKGKANPLQGDANGILPSETAFRYRLHNERVWLDTEMNLKIDGMLSIYLLLKKEESIRNQQSKQQKEEERIQSACTLY